MWRSDGYQRFVASKVTSGNAGALVAFYELLAPTTAEHKIKRELDRLRGPLADRLRREFPGKQFKDAKAWAEAMSNEIEKFFLPAAMGSPSRPEEEPRFPESVSDELFDRELAFEERNQAALKRAIDLLLELKNTKRPISFRAIQRFGSNSAKSSAPNSGRCSAAASMRPASSSEHRSCWPPMPGPATRRSQGALAWAARRCTGPSDASWKAIWSGR
jgi:hypothetical protein